MFFMNPCVIVHLGAPKNFFFSAHELVCVCVWGPDVDVKYLLQWFPNLAFLRQGLPLYLVLVNSAKLLGGLLLLSLKCWDFG